MSLKKKSRKQRCHPDVEKRSQIRQLNRLEQMHPESAEATIVRTYLDWLVELPWSISTVDNWILRRLNKFWMKITMIWKKLKSAF